MNILSVNEESKDKVYQFISLYVNGKVDMDIVQNASYVEKDDQIIGVLSFETFQRIGLIRYFIFSQTVSDDIVYKLLDSVKRKASKLNIFYFVTLVMKKEIKDLFESLGFSLIDNKKVYVEESCVAKSNFKDIYILKCDLEKV